MNFKKLLEDNRAQVSLEFIIILGVVILVAILVGYYLKQSASKNSTQVRNTQNKILDKNA